MVRSLDLVVLFLSVFFGIAAAQNTTGTVVDLSYAKYRATYNSTLDINSFLGLPFAAPPTGQLRWKAPLPYAPPPGLNATIIDTKRGPACVQGYPFWTTGDVSSGIPVAGSEDCLVLDIFTPGTVRDGAKLPVLLSIPGGGYTMGDASLVPPFALMQHAQNAFIFVNIQYRLGAYGFAGSDEYINQGGAANVGLLDQRFAMEWVQKNIAVFGGDPEKVTIQGGSAGGGSVTSHMIWRGGVEKAPFRAAMADFPWWQQQLREEQLAVQFGYLLSSANCSTLACLRDLPEESLKTASQATYRMGYRNGAYGYGSFYYGPYIDGELLLDLPSREFKAGHFAKLPMMVSREGLEGVTFSNQSMKTIEEETADMKKHFPFASKTFIVRLYELYPRETFNSIFWQRQTWFGSVFSAVAARGTRYVEM
jgi:carboxylesterase type B